jgi:predicted PurR-regulated permease PerM|tara:strand:- start:768 stop:1976 length:1209 start_codon:yes stop_codon:yes gene_type:complete
MAGDSEKQATHDITKLHLWQIQWVRDLLLLLIILFGIWLGYAMRDITVPLLVSLLLAYLFEPLISYLANHPKFPLGRIPVISGILLILSAGLLIVLAVTIPMVISQTSSLIHEVQDGHLRTKLEQFNNNFVPEDIREEVSQSISYLPSEKISENTKKVPTAEKDNADLFSIAKTTGGVALGLVGRTLSFVILVVLIPFYFFFFSLWFPKVVEFMKGIVPNRGNNNTFALLIKMDAAVAGFVRGRIVIAFIMAVLLAIGWLVVGVPYAILLGIGVGILCSVPFLGLVGIPISIGLLFLDQLGVPEADRMVWWGILLWPTLIFGIVQAIDGWLLTPLIAGRATNLDPVTIFVAVLAGGSVLGAYGMLLAIPIAACIKILIQDRLLPKIRAWARGDADDPLPFDD